MSGPDFELIKEKISKISTLIAKGKTREDPVTSYKSQLDTKTFLPLLIKEQGDYIVNGLFKLNIKDDKFKAVFYIDAILNEPVEILKFKILNLDLKTYGSGIGTIIQSNGIISTINLSLTKKDNALVLKTEKSPYSFGKGRLMLIYPFLISTLNHNNIVPTPIDNQNGPNDGGPSGH